MLLRCRNVSRVSQRCRGGFCILLHLQGAHVFLKHHFGYLIFRWHNGCHNDSSSPPDQRVSPSARSKKTAKSWQVRCLSRDRLYFWVAMDAAYGCRLPSLAFFLNNFSLRSDHCDKQSSHFSLLQD